MIHPKAFSFQIYLPTGQPSGLRIVDRSNWTGQGMAFPRSSLEQARNREELQRTGVYVLWNRDGTSLLPSVYIGEAERVVKRLNDHNATKDFWTDAVAFTAKDDSLDKAHVQYLEARLVNIATGAGRCELENANAPSLPSLSEAKVADAERFLEDILLCLPIVGVHFFESPSSNGEGEQTDQPRYLTIDYSNSKVDRLTGIKARGYESADGFVITQDSLAVKDATPSFEAQFPHESAYRSLLKEQGVLVQDEQRPNALRFTQDLVCSSPSRAAGVVRGTASNGREDWKDSMGRSLNDIAKLELEQSELPL